MASAERSSSLARIGERSVLWRFIAAYGALFCAFGVASPFLPALLQQHGVPASLLGVVIGAGTAIRLVAGPLGGRIADRTGRPVLVLAALLAVSAAVALGYVSARGFLVVLLVSVGHAAVLAPQTPLADALALGSADGPRGFPYGWVRGAGSAAFIAGTLLAGQLAKPFGLGVIIWLNAGFLALAAPLAGLLPNRVAGTEGEQRGGRVRDLLRVPGFPTLMAVAALIGGSQAMHDGFEVIRWRAAGLSDVQSSILWSLSVASEVVVFVLIGGRLLAWLGPSRALLLSAGAGIVRWGAAASTAAFGVMAVVEPLQGLTFALMHLACMQLIRARVPAGLAATAQAFYGTVALGAATAVFSAASGPLYARYGAAAFWAASALCGAAIPFALALDRQPAQGLTTTP